MLDKPGCPWNRALAADAARLGALTAEATAVRVSWLLVHGDADELVPLQDSEDARVAAGGRPDLVGCPEMFRHIVPSRRRLLIRSTYSDRPRAPYTVVLMSVAWLCALQPPRKAITVRPHRVKYAGYPGPTSIRNSDTPSPTHRQAPGHRPGPQRSVHRECGTCA